MHRAGHENTMFFIGTEVEHTPAHGKKTLFVVGAQSVDAIVHHMANHSSGIEHVFFGANHSFDPKNNQEWHQWESLIRYFLERGYLCSLDIPTSAVEEFNESGLCEYNNFIPQIRVSVPYVQLWNYNTMIKIDDRDFDATNPGVWCHSLHTLMSRKTFTPWSDYDKDQTL
jgi:hypothetical protein